MDYQKIKKDQFLVMDETKYHRNRWLLDLFMKYEDYYRNEIERMIRNQRMYWGVGYGQWPAYAVEILKAKGKTPHQYNIIAKKIESQIGNYIANGFDMKFMTVDGKKSDWTFHLQDMLYSDRSNCDWDSSEIIALRDSHVMVGYERMFISDRYDADFGNIAFEACPPTHIYLSPSWKGPNAWDIPDYFEYGMYSVSEIMELFPKVKDELIEWKRREEWSGINFGEYMGGIQKYRNTDEKWGDYHRVITFHSVKKTERKWEYDLVNRCPFPETGFEPNSAEDREAKQKYMQEAGIQEGQYTTVKQNKRIKRVEVICPSLHNEMFLAAGKDRIQTNNCNIYPIGNIFYGQYRGAVDDLHDTQIDINKSRMNINDMQERTARGAMILDEALAGGSSQKKREIEAAWNDPAARIWVEEGSMAELGPHGGVIELKGVTPTPDLFNQTSVSLDLADRLSKMPAAMDARSESTTESGKLYQSKVQVGLIGQKFDMEGFKRHKKEKVMAFILQAKITYSGFPRYFSKSGKDGESLGINIPGLDPIGRRVIINDISTMPEMRIIVVPSTSGVAIRTELTQRYTETLPLLQDPNDRLIKLIMIEGLYENQDMPEDKKEEIKKAISMLKMMEAMRLSSQMSQMQATMAQMGLIPDGAMGGVKGISATPDNFDEETAMRGTPQDVQLSTDQGV